MQLDDGATYARLGRGETVGVFPLESSGMRDVLTKLKPDAFEVIIALVALYRPGPMDNIPKFIACKQGREPADYLHPMLEGTLKETFGVIIYQEQVMEIARVLSGFTLGQADILRRAMGKKDKAEMAAQRKAFIAGAMKNDVPEWQAENIFELVNKFAGYGFNKSHAAAYALIAYQTAYFKANHPVEFFAASMSLELGNTDKLNVFRKELVDTGIALLQPDVNHSGAAFLVDRDADGKAAIRYALAAVKNVGEQAMQALVDEREANGPYKNLFDFAGRLDPRVINKRQIENLARAGAFDCLEPNRAKVHGAAELLTRHAHAMAEERHSNQTNLFGGGDADDRGATLAPPDLPDITKWSKHERGQHAFDAMGFYLYEHPLEAFATELKRLKVTPIAEISDRIARDKPPMITLAGIMAGKQERRGARGRFAFITLSDPSGDIEVALFSEILESSRELLDTGAPLLIKASAQSEGDLLRLNAHSIQSLNEVVAKTVCDLEVHMVEAPALGGLHEILARAGAGRGRVPPRIALDAPAGARGADPGIAHGAWNAEIAWLSYRYATDALRPLRTDVHGDPHTELQSYEEQVRVYVVLNYRPRTRPLGKITRDVRPRATAVLALHHVGTEVAALPIVERDKDCVGIASRGKHVGHVAVLRQPGDVVYRAPIRASVLGNLHEPVICADVQQSLE